MQTLEIGVSSAVENAEITDFGAKCVRCISVFCLSPLKIRGYPASRAVCYPLSGLSRARDNPRDGTINLAIESGLEQIYVKGARVGNTRAQVSARCVESRLNLQRRSARNSRIPTNEILISSRANSHVKRPADSEMRACLSGDCPHLCRTVERTVIIRLV